jgi:uncharacterized protein (DUF2235 family)
MKRIVICCDGTWNAPDKNEAGVPLATNVVKIAMAVKPVAADGALQLLYYDPGVGTAGNILKRMYDGATGSGLSENIRDAYRYLITHYALGDELYLFGFSRGAFTVRSLAGLIRNGGILKRDALSMVDHAYKLYRSGSKSTHPKEKEATLFRRTYAVADVTPVKVIGVWDTVGSLGNPLLMNGLLSRRNRFHDTDLSSTVANAFHALAIDEKRRNFKATLWNQQPHAKDQILEQIWFAGVHSNIGGGYATTGLSDIALEWMCEKVRPCGLDLEDIKTNPDPLHKSEESWTGFYKLLPPHHRPIAEPHPDNWPTNESVHPSVCLRYKNDPSYRPKNLEDFFVRFPALKP